MVQRICNTGSRPELLCRQYYSPRILPRSEIVCLQYRRGYQSMCYCNATLQNYVEYEL